jgi:hypothetical protein
MKKNPSPVGFTGEVYQIFKVNLMLTFQKLKKREHFETHSVRPANVTPTQRQTKHYKKTTQQYPL